MKTRIEYLITYHRIHSRYQTCFDFRCQKNLIDQIYRGCFTIRSSDPDDDHLASWETMPSSRDLSQGLPSIPHFQIRNG